MSQHLAAATWSGQSDRKGMVRAAAIGCFAASAACAVLVPPWFWLPFSPFAIAGVVLLVFRHTIAFSIAWLLLAGATLEMTLMDLVGPETFEPTIAVVKGTGLALALVCALRYGAVVDVWNPTWAFLAMFVAGAAHGLHPGLTFIDSLRSLAGSVIPFAFTFARLPRAWADAVVRTTAWIPLLNAAASAVLALSGLRPMFFEMGGERLGALGHPAFLAGFCLAAIYACLIEMYRDGRPRWHWLLAANFTILLLTGARAPIAYGVAVGVIVFSFVRSPGRRAHRLLPLLVLACLLPVLALLAGELPELRLFNVLSNEAGNLSGRDLLWPEFERAAAASPWVGWGVGAGNTIIPPDSELVRLIQSWAAHNEYLRIYVEGGQLGRGLLILCFVMWVVRHTARLLRTDRIIMRVVFLAFAAHAVTDNVLISTTACVFFAFAAAVFARTPLRHERELA
jgi:O-antigen ligase